VGRHQAVRVARPIEAGDNFPEQFKERTPITVVAKESAPCNAVGGDVVRRTFRLNSRASGH
jgi:hypothetical protein